MTRVVTAAIAMTLGLCCVARAGVDARDIDAAIDSAKKYLYSQQKNGEWEQDFDHHGDQSTGQTALVLHALISAGESHQDQRLVKAIEFLKKTPTTGVYALGVRCQFWSELPQSPDVRTALSRDAKLLINGIQREGKPAGFYNYNLTGKAYSLSRAHYAVLGVWAAAESGVEVPNSYWQLVEKSWVDEQDPSGGWSYKGKDYKPYKSEKPYDVTPGMTADGIATLFITQDYLHADEALVPHGNVKNPHIDKAMEWMSSNFDRVSKDEQFNRDYPLATLYAVERIGTASGLKYFNNIDWYQLGAERLLRNQRSSGSWKGDSGSSSDVSGTCFALLFLARGRAPIVFNKLDYDLENAKSPASGTPGNWNQRPRDVANVTRWIGKETERTLNWQIVNLAAAVTDLHDAPVMYIAGNQELKFTKEETDKLRSFVEEGGMIFANADGTATPFVASFKKLGNVMFPAYEFRQLPADHIIFTGEQFPAAKWTRKPAVLSLGNGAREFMLIVPDVDLARSWQVQETKSREELFQLAANIFLYSIDKKDALTKGQTYIVERDSRVKPTQTLAVARLKYAGNWDPEPGGWRRMSAILNNDDRLKLDVSIVDPAVDSLAKINVAHLTGIGKFKLSETARAAIKKFVEAGGTLIADSAGGNADCAQSIENELSTIFGAGAAQLKTPLPVDSPIYQRNGKKIESIAYRTFAREKLVGELKAPRLRGMTINKRLAVIYSAEDLSVGMVGQPVDGIIGYTPASATAIMRAILLNAAKSASAPPSTAPAVGKSGKSATSGHR